jgi:copper homeostasis protein
MSSQLEIACFNLASVLIAKASGIHRIELCENFWAGGLTPNQNVFEIARENFKGTIYVMIRPMGGGFNYTESSFEIMQADIVKFKNLGANGFVFGILDDLDQIDLQRNQQLVALAYPLPCTFHRAFDVCGNYQRNLEDVICCGFKTVLTSGYGKSALAGVDVLKWLIKESKERISILPGGGVRSTNIKLLHTHLNANLYHTSGILADDMADQNEIEEILRLLS